MSMNDPIADLLTRIRNALGAKHDVVDIPASALKEQICEVLKREGYIEDFNRVDDGLQGILHVTLRYLPSGEPVLKGLRRVSKPSLRVRARCNEIKPVRSGLGITILTTSSGVMTSKQAREARVGGEVLCEVW
ncbi:MAG TPA: 30S ribosomal protein S8 [Candidatus Hydrogenedentes bacterium]|nr:30S ribosomal protein S8 [Candidatus Hydrogenedentota bacterium]HQH54213.1 30S ribosomal protein S8 [Candidatus Hydrogenedentota bacterium]HQM49952.1 30S ribosomal protein S8 [Candidatus Hydrogenedentota bacterium]